jgi:hypothetical protein
VWWWETVGGWRARCTFKWDIFCEAPASAQRLAVFGVGGERTSFPAPERMAVVLNKLCTDVKQWKLTAGNAQQHCAGAAVVRGRLRKVLRGASFSPCETAVDHQVDKAATLLEGLQAGCPSRYLCAPEQHCSFKRYVRRSSEN